MERAASTALPSCRPRLLSPSRLPPLLRLLARPLWGIWAGLLLSACGDDTEVVLRARQITEPRELIGGPAAKGKVGDFLLENDQLRAIIASEGQTWLGNAFGGSLVDADRVRPSRRDDRYGHGFDSFGETFPLVNLIISDPAKPMRRLETSEGSIEVRSRPGSVAVLADGSDGKEAVVRVQGAGGYLFQAIKFLNRDFLRVMLAEFKLAGMPLPLRDLARTVIDPNLDLFSLLNRLQLDFNFTTDYIVRPGKPYVIIRTTVELAPPSSESLAQCPALPAGCRLTAEQCPDGLALQQVDVPQPGQTEPVPLLCPVCSCAEPTVLLVPFTEQRSIFGDMLGDLDQWVQPGWRGGIVGGDFLFFGAQASIFIPGLGFDDDRRVFENMWQGIGSLASPFVYPWVAGTGENVSYAMTTVNPVEQPPASCPTHRLALLWVDPAAEEEVGAALVSGFGFTGGGSAGLVRGNIVDRNPIPLPLPERPTDRYAAAGDLQGWRQQATERWWADAVASWAKAEAEEQPIPGLPRLAPEKLAQVRAALEQHARLGLLPAAACQPSQMLIPLFSTSATAVMTHEDLGALRVDAQGVVRLVEQRFIWERYLVVGDGDVASVLETVHQLRGEPVGWVEGVVLEDGSGTPLRHVNVFAVRDPRRSGGSQERFASWDELRRACLDRFGDEGVVSQMQSDRGLDPVHDGDYRGPLPPGRYFLVAKSAERRASRPVAVEVLAGRTAVAHLLLEPMGHLSLSVHDESGQALPAKAVLVDVDEQGRELPWDGHGQAVLGDSRFDRGIRRAEFTIDGRLELDAEPGRYRLYVSRGIEYSIISRELELRPGRPEVVEAQLIHEVDTTGYVSGDYHVHSRTSVDSSMPLEDRLRSVAAEGVEFVTSTDHDSVTDYQPYVEKLRLRPFLATQPGVETTTLEFGHFSGYPLRFDRRDWSVHDPPPWFGLSTEELVQGMHRRADGDPDDFVVQVNHPWDGFMGYFAQAGVHGYDLQRKTPGMEMCNPQTEQISCNFDAVEVMNEKRFELVRTPTVVEVEQHNRCYQEILANHRQELFVLPKGAKAASDPGVDATVCGWLQVGPPGCADVAQRLAAAGELGEERRLELLDESDRCGWLVDLRRGFSRCGKASTNLIQCKRSAIDALKHFSVREMLLRTPGEQEAFHTLTADTDPECDLARAMEGCTEDRGRTETGCGRQPCSKRTQMLDAWFAMLDQGLVFTGMGNSDSHNRVKEVGLPRNFVRSSTDRPSAVDAGELNRAVKNHRVTFSSGPFVQMSILGAAVGETTALRPEATVVPVHVRVQTPSWFGVDRLEIYRNGRLVKQVRLEQPLSAVTDFDGTLQLPRPDEDSWYVAMAYGLNRGSELSPVYGSLIYGHLLIPTVISIGLGQIIGTFDSLMAAVEAKGFGPLINDLLSSVAESTEMPDNFPTLPVGITNPIWVDVDGGGFTPPRAKYDEQGRLLPPPFCAQPCAVPAQAEPPGTPQQSTCGENQLCIADAEGSDQGSCAIPIPAHCPPDVFGMGGPATSAAALGVSRGALRALGPAEPPGSATRTVEGLLRRHFLGQGH